MSVRRLVLALSALSIGSVSAMAADMPMKAPPMVAPPPPPYNWTGCYIGINGGVAWKSTSFDISHNNTAWFGAAFAAGSTPNYYDINNMSGGIVGGTLGCNYQINTVVIGVEADYDWATLTAARPSIPPYPASLLAQAQRRRS